jgi:uncharacterized membrane protein YccC
MLAALFTILAQNSQRPPEDDGLGIGLILLGVLIAALIAFAIFTVFTKGSKRRRGAGPGDNPHPPGRVGH